MIKIYLGNLGSGKSVCAVRDMVLDGSGRKTYTNLITKGIPNAVHIRPEHVILKTIDENKKTKFELNKDFWVRQKKPLNILWDEIHLTASARSSMSKVNMILSQFVAMARRITGMDEKGYGHFIFIAQNERTIDVNVRELASEIRFHVSRWVVDCHECHTGVVTTSERPQIETCLNCGSWNIFKRDLVIEVRKFQTWDEYFNFRIGVSGKWHFERFIIPDIDEYFRYYDTMQMEDIWSDYLSA